MADPSVRTPSRLRALAAVAITVAAVPLSAYPVVSAVQSGHLPAGAMRPYQVVADLLRPTPLGPAWEWWLDRCCDHAW